MLFSQGDPLPSQRNPPPKQNPLLRRNILSSCPLYIQFPPFFNKNKSNVLSSAKLRAFRFYFFLCAFDLFLRRTRNFWKWNHRHVPVVRIYDGQELKMFRFFCLSGAGGCLWEDTYENSLRQEHGCFALLPGPKRQKAV